MTTKEHIKEQLSRRDHHYTEPCVAVRRPPALCLHINELVWMSVEEKTMLIEGVDLGLLTHASLNLSSMVNHRGRNCIFSALTILDSALTS